jgi:hypothetical protein
MIRGQRFLMEDVEAGFRDVAAVQKRQQVGVDEALATVNEVIEQVLAGESVDDEDKPSRGCSIKWRDGNEPDYWN